MRLTRPLCPLRIVSIRVSVLTLPHPLPPPTCLFRFYVPREDCKRINMLVRGMKGEERRTTPRGELFLYDIVANDHNG